MTINEIKKLDLEEKECQSKLFWLITDLYDKGYDYVYSLKGKSYKQILAEFEEDMKTLGYGVFEDSKSEYKCLKYKLVPVS